jgi:hypothetical protein
MLLFPALVGIDEDNGGEDFDPVAFFAQYGELERAAEHIEDGDIYRKATLGLDPIQAVELERYLALRGIGMFEDETHWLFMSPEVAGRRPPRKRSDRDPDAPAPAPTETLAEDRTAPMCPRGPPWHQMQGPPGPFCCEKRKRQVLKIECGEHPVYRPDADKGGRSK